MSDEFEEFLKGEKKAGAVKSAIWIIILMIVTTAVLIGVFLLMGAGTKMLMG
jgi:hypothetical protein